jgi:signal transduction histidine kinase
VNAAAASPPHVARTAREFVYVLSGVPIGLVSIFVLGAGIAVGISTSIALIGIPILVVLMLSWRGLATLERDRAALVLGAPIPLPYQPLTGRGFLRDLWLRVRDRATWKDLGYLGVLGTAGVAAGLLLLVLWSLALVLITLPATSVLVRAGTDVGDLGMGAAILFAIGGLVVAAAATALTHFLASGLANLARALLGPDPDAQITRLEHSRASAVDATETTLRRIERDLHDGAQHRLVAIALDLGRARQKLDASDVEGAAPLVASAHDESKRALVELRDLVRGIHPSILTDRGLDAAVSALAGRAPIPVDVTVDVDGRPPPAPETAAYYVVAEALTNVAKHSGAKSAAVEIVLRDGKLIAEVRDDGRGGAGRAPGSGLDGIAQRVDALDGTLTIDSPAGGPTSLRAEFPCEL